MKKFLTRYLRYYKSTAVDLDSEKSKKKFVSYLKNSWEFEKKNIKNVFKRYSGCIKSYSPDHASMMLELINEHMEHLSDVEKQAYVASHKTSLTSWIDVSAFEFFVAIFAGTIFDNLLFDPSVCIDSVYRTVAVMAAIIGVVWIVFRKTSLKHRFYHEIITMVENSLGGNS